MSVKKDGESRHGVELTNLDQPLFDGAEATKRDLVDYLDAVCDPILGELRGRPLSVIRVRPGQAPFMQKNLPSYTPDWVARTSVWAHASKREISYALCDDRRTLVWFANQRAVEYHPTLIPDGATHASYLVLDLDPPEAETGDDSFGLAVQGALIVREALDQVGLLAGVKTSGAKGVHVFVPLAETVSIEDTAAATRALAARAERIDPSIGTTEFVREDRGHKVFLDSTRAGGATIAAAYSPRIRPGTPVSFPVSWDDLEQVHPREFTVRSVPGRLDGADPWHEHLPAPQELPADLIAEGHEIPIARVRAMHEGKRRKREREGAAE